MQKIRKGDDVIVITGKDKGKSGKVLRVIEEGRRLVVEGANIIKKHVKPNPQQNQKGGIVDRESPVDISNVAILNPVSKKADKVAIKILEDGKKVRIFKSNQELIDI